MAKKAELTPISTPKGGHQYKQKELFPVINKEVDGVEMFEPQVLDLAVHDRIFPTPTHSRDTPTSSSPLI